MFEGCFAALIKSVYNGMLLVWLMLILAEGSSRHNALTYVVKSQCGC